MYRIREVDGFDEEIAEILTAMNRMLIDGPLPADNYENGNWWLGYLGDEVVSYAGLIPARLYNNTGYFQRVGVVPAHRGHGLQQRHMRVLEQRARKQGYATIVSDTTDNVPSGNNFIRAGYRLFTPSHPWAFAHSLYWKKELI